MLPAENFIFRGHVKKHEFASCELILVGFSLATDHSLKPFDEDFLDNGKYLVFLGMFKYKNLIISGE